MTIMPTFKVGNGASVKVINPKLIGECRYPIAIFNRHPTHGFQLGFAPSVIGIYNITWDPKRAQQYHNESFK